MGELRDGTRAVVVAAYQASLAGLDGLDPVPPRWLHLTMQDIGFADEVGGADVDRIAAAAAQRLRSVPSPELRSGPVTVLAESVALAPSPPGPVGAVRGAVREATATVLGEAAVPEPAGRFWPHVAVAYSNRDGAVAPIVERLERARLDPVPFTVRAASLIELHRDAGMYQWRELASVPLSGW
jgi:2'-5' RNA ligase